MPACITRPAQRKLVLAGSEPARTTTTVEKGSQHHEQPNPVAKNPSQSAVALCVDLSDRRSPAAGGALGKPLERQGSAGGVWWDCWNERYPQDWYTYLAKLAPRLKSLGVDGLWIPSPAKGNAGSNSMGYDIFDHYDLGDKDQKGTVATRFGTKDSLLRLVAVAHANGLEDIRTSC